MDLKSASSHRALPTAAFFVLCASLFSCCRGFEYPSVSTLGSDENAGNGGSSKSSDAPAGGGAGAGMAGEASSGAGEGGTAEAGNGGADHPSSSGRSGSGGGSPVLGSGGEGGVVGTGSYVFSETAHAQVQLGATTLMPFNHLGATCVLLYSSATGQVSFNYLKPDMAGLELAWSYDHWAPGFLTFTPYYQGSVDYFVGLHAGFNQVHFDRFPANLQGPEILLITAPKARFSHLTSYALNGTPYLLFYDALSGSAVVQKPVAGGSGANVAFMTVLDWGITSIASLERSTDAHLLLFDAARRKVQYVLAADDHFESVTSATFEEPLALSAVFADDAAPFFLIYGHDGSSVLYEFSHETFEPTVAWRGKLPAGATQIASLEQGGTHGFLLGDDASGWLRFYRVARVPS